MIYAAQDTNKICYMILPEGIREDLEVGVKGLAGKYGVSIVVIPGANWNDDLTPWPAEGVFKKAKPFGGQAASFLDKLTNEIIPETEKTLGVKDAERTIMGVSLSGLFAVWACFNTNAFTNVISISGSLWYDGFVEWMNERMPSPQLEKVCMLLGEKEKDAKEKRMATVEERTHAAAEILKANSQASILFELVEGTHFSPILPRLERAFEEVHG
ncbi:MAG: alpha/beta hydrolase [Bacteroidales bacterium]|nr:alpha/beta hydrolase [Bacteroidales bacterium]